MVLIELHFQFHVIPSLVDHFMIFFLNFCVNNLNFLKLNVANIKKLITWNPLMNLV